MISNIKRRLHQIVFEADTPAGKWFDILLIVIILLSVVNVILESVPSLKGHFLLDNIWLEWTITTLFLAEYMLRIWIIKKPLRYIFSFYGLIDLLSILPSFLELVFTGAGSFMVIRVLRIMRIFRILKLSRYLKASNMLMDALKASRIKIYVFLFAVINLVIVMGTLMYVIEGGQHGFDSIPRSIYWAVVTLTTVGYGDIAPETPIGQFISSVVMILGYGIIAIPTGIVSVELSKASDRKEDLVSTIVCNACGAEGHDKDAIYCKYCGGLIHDS